MEDLDAGRVRPEYFDTQLRWLGLDWDEGPDVGGPHAPYTQSERTGLYDDAIARLAGDGLVYECFCSRREIAAAASAPHEGEEGPRYPGTCRDLSPSQIDDRRARSASALRFRTPAGTITFSDAVQGDVVVDPAAEVGDFVIRRRDGAAAYQLAVVVDDAAMGVTHVLRGADLLSSTARQIMLYRAMGLAEPAWIHAPLLRDADGDRLSKRHGPESLRDLREGGVRPEWVVGWLAASCGLLPSPAEVSAADLIPGFGVDVIHDPSECHPERSQGPP
jgi:glutamyl-tRNA synthetase